MFFPCNKGSEVKGGGEVGLVLLGCLKSNYHRLPVYNTVTLGAVMNSIVSMLPFTIRPFNSHHVLYNFSGFKAVLTLYPHQAITLSQY